jgi:hypothetical protein
MITDVAQRMMGNADRLRDIAGGGVQQNEQQDMASIFSNILQSAGQSGAQWSDGERVRLITGALDFVSADQDPNAQGAALQSFSGLVRRLASDDVLGGGGRQTGGKCGCNGSGGAEPTEPTEPPPSSGGSSGCQSGEPFKVNGNTVDTGRYCITASNEHKGQLEVTDKQTGKKFKVWGDPHIETGDGDKTDFHRKAATFELPDGTKITIDPTNGEGKTYIEKVAITRGDQAAEMTGFRGDLKTELKSGQGQALDQQYEDGTVLKTKNGEIDDLVLPNGQEITGNNVKDIDGFAGTGPAQGTDDQILQNLNGVIDGLHLSPQEKDALKTVVSLLGRVMNGAGSSGGAQQPQPIAAPRTDEGGEPAPTQQQAGAGGGPFDQIMSALSSLIGRLNLPQNEKDALTTVVSLLGRLLGGAGGGQQDVPQAA